MLSTSRNQYNVSLFHGIRVIDVLGMSSNIHCLGCPLCHQRLPFVATALNRDAHAEEDDDDDDKKDDKSGVGSSVNYSAMLVTTAVVLTYRTLHW